VRLLLPESVVPTLEMLRGECVELETEVLGEMGTKMMRKSDVYSVGGLSGVRCGAHSSFDV